MEVEAVLRAAGFSSQVRTLLQMPLASPHGTVLGCDAGGTLAGVTAAVAFPNGRSGWIGAVGVRPAARRRGIATALTESAISWLHARGAATISLYATELGRPLYEQLGFVAEGNTVAWRGARVANFSAPLRALRETDRDTVEAIDRAATGEVRSSILDLLRPLDGLGAVDADDMVRGFALRTPWGTASPVLAGEADHGLSLLAAMVVPPGGGTLIVPEDNLAAAEAVREWRLTRLNEALRMRLGPALDWRPAQQFGTFNLFWG
jgi:GNAT superfamily N-acetyltransferase